MALKIEFYQPKPRIEDWRVRYGEFTLGNVWRAAEGRYIANCSHAETAPTADAAFKLARKQVKRIIAASR